MAPTTISTIMSDKLVNKSVIYSHHLSNKEMFNRHACHCLDQCKSQLKNTFGVSASDFLAQTDFSGLYDASIYKQLTKDLRREYVL